MENNLRSLSCVILFASLSVGIIGAIGFLNNAYAENANMSANVKMNATVAASTNMTGHMSANMTGKMSANMTGKMNANMTGNTSNGLAIVQKILSPLQQVKSGVSAKSVQCNQGFTLIIKAEDSSPACVSSYSAQELTVRGWGTAP